MSSKGVAFVTGAAQGIGREIALRLADDGFDVAINDIVHSKAKVENVSEEIVGKGRRCIVTLGDVSLEEDVKSMVETVVKDLGSLDVMVANAGICITKSFLDTTISDWDRISAINNRGTFLCYKYAAIQMIAQGRGGRIIGASSVAGKQGVPMLSAYCTTKFAIRGLTQVVASELGKHAITVNAYAPGCIDTEMLRELGTTVAGNYDAFREVESKIPVGHLGTTKDIANLVSFLASKESHFITGQTVSCNGGRYFD